MLDKWSLLWFGAGLFVALVTSGARAALRTRGPYLTAIAALGLFLPHVVWEVGHGFPTLEFMRNALGEMYVPLSPLSFLREQLGLLHPLSLPLSLAALGGAFRNRYRNDGRFLLVIVFLTTLGILLASKGAKPEYLVAAYPMLFAAGATEVEEALRQRLSPGRGRALVTSYLGVLFATAAALAPFVLPILREETVVRYQAALGRKPTTSERKELSELPQQYADMHGWPELVDAVGAVFRALPEADRARTMLWAASGGYGPAAALDRFGARYALPPARSGHNNYWLLGPGSEDGNVVLVVGGRRARIEPLFASLEQVATFACRWCMPSEDHKPICVGRGLKPSMTDFWTRIRADE